MPLPGLEPGVKPGPIRELGSFRGGRGTINASSWAHDGKRFAVARYEPVARSK